MGAVSCFFFSYLWCCFVVFIEIHGFALLIMRHIPVRSGVALLFFIEKFTALHC